MRTKLSALFLFVLFFSTSWAIQPDKRNPGLDHKAFFKKDLAISSANAELENVILQLPNRQEWDRFFGNYGSHFRVFIDPRSATPTNIMGHVPLIPGDGVDNRITIADVSRKLGRNIHQIDASVVADLVKRFIQDNHKTLGLDVRQMGKINATQVTEKLWQVSIPQAVRGIPVRYGRIAATISHGNLVVIGTESWGDVRMDTVAKVPKQKAIEKGFAHAGGKSKNDRFVKDATMEIVPYAPGEYQSGESFNGPLGKGYRHRLVWSYVFVRDPDQAEWEVMVDAQTEELISFQDVTQYVKQKIEGGVYPLTATDICPSNEFCGIMQSNWPMPWANTGLASPNNYANSAGVFEYTSGNVTTTLNGRYIRISDTCGSVSSSAAGSINLGGTNGQHDCTTPGSGGAGNTASARSAFYELNRIAEQARGWLPSNAWLTNQLTANVNIVDVCNANYSPLSGQINFYRSGGGCRNTGELTGVFDHEWGHALDDNDSGGSLSNSSEAYADIAALYRYQSSCVGHGFWWTLDRGCGQTADGTGFNANEANSGFPVHCATNCSGVRDADWARHVHNSPDTPQNFVCTSCSSSTGPCGRQVHCAAAPVRQAAWDLVARDLVAAPFNYNSNTAFMIGNKLFYEGSGNVGTWHACDCTAGTSNGCGATNGYTQWLAADDDNGNVNDGTPHMSAIYAAFNRHNIACSTPAPVNSGCSGAPASAPTVTATPGDHQVALSWTSVAGASKYWVLRTEGHAGCNYGKVRLFSSGVIPDHTGTSFTDTRVVNGRTYNYNVVAVASSNDCFGPSQSTCASATPAGGCTLPGAPSLVSPVNSATNISTTPALDWSDVSGATSYDVQVCSDSSCANVVRPANVASSTWTVSPALSNSTTYYWRARANNGCGAGSFSSIFSFTTASGGGGCTPASASFDATLQAPRCSASACGCDTGASLVNGRANLGPEPNQPNTINDSCADGTSGTYHSDESLDRLSLSTNDGTALAGGKTVTISATAWCWGTADSLDLYYTSNAASPSWTLIGTQTCSAAGARTFTASYTLPSSGTIQAIRGQFRYQSDNLSCSSGAYNDRDDLIFAVNQAADTIPPTTSITSPTNGATVSGTTTVSANASDNVGVTRVEFYLDGSTLLATDTTSPYSISWNTTTAANGAHNLTSRAFDAANNSTTSTAVNVTVNNVPAGDLIATFNATYQAPACPSGGRSCDTGATIINGRGSMSGGVEQNAPNTINDSCVDGNSGTYHVDESIDRLKIATNDGTALASGKAVTVTVTVWCYDATDRLDLYRTATIPGTGSPTWTLIGTQSCTAAGVRTFTATYTLPAGANQAVRGNFRFGGTASTCTSGGYNDRDDLVFGVQ